jgi:methylated-DNA-protein-cysteine methyltransferase related protein
VLGPPDDYAELVLDVVAAIPQGRVCSYGAIGRAVREVTGTGSARVVGRVMALYGSEVPWWRVVTASGALADRVAREQRARLLAEDVPFARLDPPRVDMARAGHEPAPPEPPGPERLGPDQM